MEEKITIRCDKCRKRFSVPASLEGKRARCMCGNVVVVRTDAERARGVAEHSWYYAKGGEREGPVSLGEIQRLRSSGELGDDDLVWCKGMGTWATAASVEDINVPAEEGPAAEEEGEASVETPPQPQPPVEAALKPEAAPTTPEPPEPRSEETEDLRQWYTAQDGAQAGPMGTAELREMVRSGEVRSSALVWTDGMRNWAPLTDVEEFSKLLSQAAASGEQEAGLPPGPVTRSWARRVGRALGVLSFALAALIIVGGIAGAGAMRSVSLPAVVGLVACALLAGTVAFFLVQAAAQALGILADIAQGQADLVQQMQREHEKEE